MDEPENSVVVRVTDAPEPYDGFGTHTIEVLPLLELMSDLVEIAGEAHPGGVKEAA